MKSVKRYQDRWLWILLLALTGGIMVVFGGCAALEDVPVTQVERDTGGGIPASPDEGAPDRGPTYDGALLAWEGQALFTEAPSCHRLVVTSDQRTLIGPCDGELQEVDYSVDREGGLLEMIDRLAPLTADTPSGRIALHARGEIAGPAWERAVAAWAQTTHAELASGRAGAANRTVLAWNVGEHDGQCQMLLVLAHGYATAGETPCPGGDLHILAQEWLADDVWDQFDSWLYGVEPYYRNNYYLDGRGERTMGDEEAVTLDEWALSVYAELVQGAGQSNADAADDPATHSPSCPTPQDGQLLYQDAELGFCLLYPADYMAVQSHANTVDFVKDSVMNHIDPRASIQVEDAAGRTLEDVTAQMEADYVPEGFPVLGETVTLDGAEAVMLDNLPGQDLNRRLAVVHAGRVYSFFIAPVGEEDDDAREQAEHLHGLITDSFRFVTSESQD